MLSPIERLAATKLADKTARDEVSPGIYPVDFCIRVQGALKIGEDTDAKPTCSVPWQALAILALGKLNNATIDDIMQEASHASYGPEPVNAEDAEWIDGMRQHLAAKAKEVEKRILPRLEALIAQMPRIDKRGAVTATVTFSRVEPVIGGGTTPHGMETEISKSKKTTKR